MTPELLPIAVDAMGGENAPTAEVRGSLLAAAAYRCRIVLVGDEAAIERELASAAPSAELRDRISIAHTTEVITMDEHPATAVRQKKDSSLVRAFDLAATGKASAVVSAGNSGATLAGAVFGLKRIEHISRPAIGTLLPSASGHTFIFDVGANTDCKAEWLFEFAVMGNVYAKEMMGIAEPRIALLSNGEEDTKGSQLVLDAAELIKTAPLNFVGNVEGKGLFTGVCDVAICDGFVGNVALKVAEGVGEYLFSSIKEQAMSSARGRVGGALLKSKMRGIRDRVDYRHTGGALMLGVRGEAVIAHGRSDALAIQNAIRVAHQAAVANVSGIIAGEMAQIHQVSERKALAARPQAASVE